jgi:hypothetical protein
VNDSADPAAVETDAGNDDAVSAPPATGDVHVPLFGARRRVRELEGKLAALRAALERVGGLSLIEIERQRDLVATEVAAQTALLESGRIEAQAAREREHTEATKALTDALASLEKDKGELLNEVAELRTEVVETREVALLQEAGIYEYHHPLSAAVSYQFELEQLQTKIKAMARAEGGAVLGNTNWTVNGSAPQGRKMVRDFSKLMLRAYNAEADNLVRGLKPYKLEAAVERLTKVATTIARLGSTMDIRVSDEYQRLRIRELEMTADYAAKLAEEKEHEREERNRLREERKAQQEMERERARLEKERQHYVNALAAVEANEDAEAATRLRAQLAEIERAIVDVDYRAANIRAGYVYVISNVGSFGESVVKIGMTRRLDPTDRVRELGDASVPFRYDTHALFFSDDAVGIEAKLHDRFAEKRVNRINQRREFFNATPHEAKAALLELTGELLDYQEIPEALEFRQSENLREAAAVLAPAIDESGDALTAVAAGPVLES